MILEGILTTTNRDGTAHVAVMGAVVDEAESSQLEEILLRPFRTTRTFENLRRTGQAVFHVTDDVQLVAQAAIGRVKPMPELMPARGVEGWILADCCRWYALRADGMSASEPRAELHTKVVDRGRVRDYFGLNRAKHAVVEGAILATRTHLIAAESIRADMARLWELVEKTGGRRERTAFALLLEHVLRAEEAS